MHDIDFVIHYDDETLPKDSALVKWYDLMNERGLIAGFPLDAIKRVPGIMRKAGFEDVVVAPIKYPTNRWPRYHKHKEIGLWVCENFI